MNHTMLAEVLICDSDGVLAHQSDHATIRAPDDILDGRAVDLGDGLLLLDIVEDNRGGGTEKKTGSATVEDLVGLDRRLDRLDDRVLQVAHLDQLETVSRTNTSAR